MSKPSQLERAKIRIPTQGACAQSPNLTTGDLCTPRRVGAGGPDRHLSSAPSIRKTCDCTPHLDMILFSFSIKTKTTTTKARKRAYLLLILRLCRKSRQSWGRASPFSMGRAGPWALSSGRHSGPGSWSSGGGTLILWRDGLSGPPCLQIRANRGFSTRLLRVLALRGSQTPEAPLSWTLPQRDLKSGHLSCY